MRQMNLRAGGIIEEVIYSADGCRHVWEHCVHIGLGSTGSHGSCVVLCEFNEYHHDVCRICGKQRYIDSWLVVAERILESRRKSVKS